MNRRGFFRQLCKKCFFVTCLLFILLFAANAMADFSFNLIYANQGLMDGATDNYANVNVSLNGKTATITFTALGDYLLKDKLGVQVSNTVTSNYIGSTDSLGKSIDSLSNLKYYSTKELDGWGNFNAAYSWGNENLTSFSFSVTNTSSIDWNTAKDVLALNSTKGYYAAAHILPPAPNDKKTGFAAGDGSVSPPAPPVPIPAAVWLFGSGLIGLVGIRKKFKL